MDDRCETFRKLVVQAGFACDVFEARPSWRTWERTQEQMGKWLLRLPKPVAIMACNDERGQHVVDTCRCVGISVPDQAAIIGVDNDQELCNLSTPALSSVEVNSEQIGFSAAALLDQMMTAGVMRPPEDVRFPPSHVVTRLSTDTLAVRDPIVARALRFILGHATENISVTNVVDAAVTSRRYLERQMHELLGRSPNQEILRVRIQNARLLLLETDLSLPAIARKSGFNNYKYFGEVFGRETGQPPGEFRRQYRSS